MNKETLIKNHPDYMTGLYWAAVKEFYPDAKSLQIAKSWVNLIMFFDGRELFQNKIWVRGKGLKDPSIKKEKRLLKKWKKEEKFYDSEEFWGVS